MEYGVLLVPSVRDRLRLGREVDSAVARHPRGAWSRASKGVAGVGRRAIELTEIDRHANAGLGPPRDHEPAPRQKQARGGTETRRMLGGRRGEVEVVAFDWQRPGSTLPALVGAPSRNDATIQASRGRYVRLTQRGR